MRSLRPRDGAAHACDRQKAGVHVKPATATTTAEALAAPADVPARLSTGDVCAVLGMSRDQVRHHVRMGRLDPIVDHGYNTWRKYAPEDVVTLAEQAGITPDWSKVTL